MELSTTEEMEANRLLYTARGSSIGRHKVSLRLAGLPLTPIPTTAMARARAESPMPLPRLLCLGDDLQYISTYMKPGGEYAALDLHIALCHLGRGAEAEAWMGLIIDEKKEFKHGAPTPSDPDTKPMLDAALFGGVPTCRRSPFFTNSILRPLSPGLYRGGFVALTHMGYFTPEAVREAVQIWGRPWKNHLRVAKRQGPAYTQAIMQALGVEVRSCLTRTRVDIKSAIDLFRLLPTSRRNQLLEHYCMNGVRQQFHLVLEGSSFEGTLKGFRAMASKDPQESGYTGHVVVPLTIEHVKKLPPKALLKLLTYLPWGSVQELASDRKSTRLNSSHIPLSRMPSSA